MLESSGIPAGEAFPGAELSGLREPRALVNVQRADQGTGRAELSVRVMSPRRLGLWECQNTAVKAMQALAVTGMACRMEQMTFEEGCDCFCVKVIATVCGLLAGSWLKVKADQTELSCVTEFTAEQDRGRRLIGGVNQETPVGVTAGTGGWKFRLVRIAPNFGSLEREPEEPFQLTVAEGSCAALFSGCVLNRVKQTVNREEARVEWEGFALTREELEDGEAEV
ncbi:MAG: hypothetical protein IJ960_06535 [Oscillospiraceae bacterium]|nr:hypothetical protein [Oscillospiraceae bacterium]